MRTFVSIQQDVSNQLKQEVGTSGYWTLDEIKNAINDTYMFIADDSLCFKLIEIIEIRSGIRFYKLPFNYINGSLYRVEFNEQRINPISSNELDALHINWRSSSASIIRAYLPPGDLCATDEIGVYPLPDTDGALYNTATDTGVITTVGDDSYEEFNSELGVIVGTDGDAYVERTGAVIEISDPTNNLKIFAAKYPKRLYNDNEVFLHPISDNPRRIITYGSLAYLFAKPGEGKDLNRANYYNKRFEETINSVLQRPKYSKRARVHSITDFASNQKYFNLGDHYPQYRMN